MRASSKRQFLFGAIVFHDFKDFAMQLPALEDRLNSRIDLLDFSDQVEYIHFTPIIYHEPSRIHEEEWEYDAKKKQIHVQVNIEADQLQDINKDDFAKIIGLTLMENLQMMEVVPDQLIVEIGRTLQVSPGDGKTN